MIEGVSYRGEKCVCVCVCERERGGGENRVRQTKYMERHAD
jgi:hypothetical protein